MSILRNAGLGFLLSILFCLPSAHAQSCSAAAVLPPEDAAVVDGIFGPFADALTYADAVEIAEAPGLCASDIFAVFLGIDRTRADEFTHAYNWIMVCSINRVAGISYAIQFTNNFNSRTCGAL